jgi:hypothetical protein
MTPWRVTASKPLPKAASLPLEMRDDNARTATDDLVEG